MSNISSLTKFIAFLLFLLVVIMAQVRIERAFFFIPYSLPEPETDAISWIKDHFSNESCIFILRPTGWLDNQTLPSFEAPAKYMLLPGASNFEFFKGYLFALLSGQRSMPIADLLPDDSPYYTDALTKRILLVDGKKWGTFYSPDIFENRVLKILYETDNWRIYTLKDNITVEQINYWNSTWFNYVTNHDINKTNSVLNETIFESWKPVQGQLVYGPQANLTINDGEIGMWIETKVNISTSLYPFLFISAHLEGKGFIALDFYDNQDMVGTSWGSYSSETQGDIKVLMDLEKLTQGRNITRIAIVFSSANSTVATLRNLTIFK